MGITAEKQVWLQQMLGIDLSNVTSRAADGAGGPKMAGPKTAGSAKTDSKAALAGWKTARETAIGQLRQLESAIAGMKHPKGNEAIILVKAIQKNLTAAPTDRRSVNELQRYLETDDIIQVAERPNGFGVKVELRRPLLEALKVLETSVPD